MKTIDITGQRFGRLTAVEKVGSSKGGILWRCECDCGGEATTAISNLNRGVTKSCGCIRREGMSKRGKDCSKANTKHGMTNTPTFISWISMKQRCLNAKSDAFNHYGGRGIEVCARWLESFENFLADMGERPAKTSLDRIDMDGDYEPSNCRWASLKQQNNNKRNNRLITYEGETLTVSMWADKMGIPSSTLFNRLNKGWPAARILA